MSSVPTRAERPLGRVAVLGLGMVGGSLARAISGLELAERVTGWSPEATERDAALTAHAVTLAAASWHDAVAEADLVVLAASLKMNLALLREITGVAPEGATITDLSGLKEPVLEVVREAGLSWRWIGSHPMTPRGTPGFWASRADLFDGVRVWTVSEGAAEDSMHSIELLWTSLGAEPKALDAASHDRLMALASHLPRLTASALAEVIEHSGVSSSDLGPEGWDATRAAGSPDTWAELVELASPSLVGGLRGLAHAAERLADLLEDGDTERVLGMLTKTRRWAAAPPKGRKP